MDHIQERSTVNPVKISSFGCRFSGLFRSHFGSSSFVTDELQSNRSNVTNCYENLFDLQDYTYVKLDRLDELEITKFGNIKPGSLFFEAYVGKVMYAKEIAVI
ncbi:hypothetical protein Hdeb2414_s0017g00506851 [Helianthus debilis subsp. tardiflorus]